MPFSCKQKALLSTNDFPCNCRSTEENLIFLNILLFAVSRNVESDLLDLQKVVVSPSDDLYHIEEGLESDFFMFSCKQGSAGFCSF